jgi:hypothetical protein
MKMRPTGSIGDSDMDHQQIGTILDLSNEGTSGINPSDGGGASLLDFDENNFLQEQDHQKLLNMGYSDTLERLYYMQKLNGILRTALARGARLLARSDPEKADLFRKGINVLRRSP